MREFREKVVSPALVQLVPIPRDLIGGPKKFLTHIARDNSHNSLCYEMRLSFALTIGAAFERNIRLWLSLRNEELRSKIESSNRVSLFEWVAELKGPHAALAAQNAVLVELWELVSTARHGDGPAAKRLRVLNQRLWAHNDFDTQVVYDRVGLRAHSIRVQDSDIERYFDATIGFWDGQNRR
jgi:hypothetical protein